MDGQDGDSKKTKPTGNPYPKRGAVKKQIIKDWIGGGDNGDDGNGGGGDAGGSSTAAE